ncbi:hypothetical protein ABMC89_12565 [Sulfitobacter sp. HNIBRBA3233]|uniref:hypothetical protein n=1 Tax=Sulfitobacter marinivivus TaxID=3158558 RepID=UPI0032DF3E3A
MGEILEMRLIERVELDQGRIGALYRQLGADGADNVMCRAMEELAVRMSLCRSLWQEGKTAQLRKNARSLIAISEQLGMKRLAQVAGDVTACIDDRDSVAVSATLSRMLRTGERSLSAIWSMQERSL